MALAVSVLVVVLAAVAIGWLQVRFAPPPAYDWPVAAYRLVFALRSALHRLRLRTIHGRF